MYFMYLLEGCFFFLHISMYVHLTIRLTLVSSEYHIIAGAGHFHKTPAIALLLWGFWLRRARTYFSKYNLCHFLWLFLYQAMLFKGFLIFSANLLLLSVVEFIAREPWPHAAIWVIFHSSVGRGGGRELNLGRPPSFKTKKVKRLLLANNSRRDA